MLQVAQQHATIGVRVGAHAAGALWREFGEFGYQRSVLIEQLFRAGSFSSRFRGCATWSGCAASTSSGT